MGLFTERDEETTNEIIIGKLNRIEAKLDAVIKAMHDYDEGTLHCEYSGLPSVEAYSDEAYGESSFEAFMDDKVKDDMGDSNIQPKQKQYYKNKRSKRAENKK
jgi:hypothetical protein